MESILVGGSKGVLPPAGCAAAGLFRLTPGLRISVSLANLTLLCVSNVDKALARNPSTLLDAILFVAAAAIIPADVAECCLERIQVFYACFGGLGITTKSDEPCFEVVHTLPDLRTGGIRIISRRLVDQILLKQSGPLGRRVLKRRKNLVSLREVERISPLAIAAPIFA